MKFRVMKANSEYALENLLNDHSARGWVLHSVCVYRTVKYDWETEYTAVFHSNEYSEDKK